MGELGRVGLVEGLVGLVEGLVGELGRVAELEPVPFLSGAVVTPSELFEIARRRGDRRPLCPFGHI